MRLNAASRGLDYALDSAPKAFLCADTVDQACTARARERPPLTVGASIMAKSSAGCVDGVQRAGRGVVISIRPQAPLNPAQPPNR